MINDSTAGENNQVLHSKDLWLSENSIKFGDLKLYTERRREGERKSESKRD